MSSVKGQSQYDSNRHLNYISTAAFGDNIFNYTVAQDMSTFVYVGVLRSLLSVGTASGAQGYNTIGGASPTAPAGRILRVNNKKIFPSANPCATITVSSGGTSGTSSSTAVTGLWSQMVGVIDILTGLSGFIDPNDSMFAIYNVDKAIDYSNDGGTPSDALHKGPSLYTAGNVTADLNIVTNNGAIGVDVAAGAPGTITSLNGITANNGNIVAALGNIVATVGALAAGTTAGTAGTVTANTLVNAGTGVVSAVGQIRVNRDYTGYTLAAAGTINMDIGLSQVYTIAFTGSAGSYAVGINATANLTLTGSVVYVILLNNLSAGAGNTVVITWGSGIRENVNPYNGVIPVGPTVNMNKGYLPLNQTWTNKYGC